MTEQRLVPRSYVLEVSLPDTVGLVAFALRHTWGIFPLGRRFEPRNSCKTSLTSSRVRLEIASSYSLRRMWELRRMYKLLHLQLSPFHSFGKTFFPTVKKD